VLLLGIAMLLTLAASAASAAVFIVNSTNDAPDASPGDGRCATAAGHRHCTLRAAVMEANALAALGTSTANVIVLPAATYTLTVAGRGEDNAATGDLDVNGGALVVVGAHAVIDGNQVDRIFDLGPLTPVQFTLRNVTIQNGNVESTPPNLASGGPDVGAAIRILKDSGLKVTHSTFRHNRAGARGGAIGMPPTAATVAGANPAIITELRDVLIELNSAGVEGGGLFNNRVAILHRVIVRDNRVTGLVGNERGAGIAQSGDLTLTESIVSGNSMSAGNVGGIANRGDPAALPTPIFGTIRLTNVTVSNNSAPQGGGIGNGTGATAIITNTTISGNRATVTAGGLVNGGTATLTNVTFSGNSAPLGGGIVTAGPPLGAPNASTTLRNTILSRGHVGSNCLLPFPGAPPPISFARAPISGGDNISSDTSCNLAGPGDRNGINPLLGPLADNGGFTPTHALLHGSPAIDAVFNNPCPPPATDQRGVPRPQDGDGVHGALCDIGAYEVWRG